MKEAEVLSIKKKIKDKFGSISRFSRLTNVDRDELQKAFMAFYYQKPEYESFLLDASKLVDEMEVKFETGDIDPTKLNSLKLKIDENGGVYQFCKNNPQFSKDSVFQILSGRRKKMSPVIECLFKHFEIV